MKSAMGVASAILATAFLGIPAAAFAEQGAGDAALAGALKQATLPLERGLAASSREGTPISAKYELEDEGLQLSVYTMRDGSIDVDLETGDIWPKEPTFAEVIVDHRSGRIGKVVPIKEGDDLVAARSQTEAMARSKRSLEAATAQAVKVHGGYRAVSAMPELKDGHAAVKVVLVNGGEWKTVYEKLD